MRSHKPIRKFLPLTYEPKINGVLNGSIFQSIRVDTILEIGDLIAFHGWEGIPYKSPWSFRTPYLEINWAEPIRIHEDFIYYPWEKTKYKVGDNELKYLAELDGINPPTGEELLRILHSYHGPGTLKGKVIRWNPAPIIRQREMLAGNLEILKPSPSPSRDPPPPPGIQGPTPPEKLYSTFLQIGDIKNSRQSTL
jgi:hypothetical protein